MCRAAVSAYRACFGAVFPFEGMLQFSLFSAEAAFFLADPINRFILMRQGTLFAANCTDLFAASFDRLEPMVFPRLPAAGALLHATAR